MPIGDYCRRDVVTVTPRTTLADAARTMASRDVGAVPVVHGAAVLGMVTDRDVALAALGEEHGPETEVGELLLHKPLIIVHEDSPLGVAAAIMRRHALRRLPVLDADDHLVGILTSDDLLALFAGELGGLTRVIAAQAPGAPVHGTLHADELLAGGGI